MKTHTLLICLLVGLALTALSVAVVYPYCLNGSARDLPLPVWIPRCEATGLSLSLPSNRSGVQVLDLARGAADVLLWGGLGLGVQAWLRRRRNVPA